MRVASWRLSSCPQVGLWFGPLSGRGPIDLDASVQHLQTPEGLAELRGFLVYLVTGETGHGRIPLLGGPPQPTNANRRANDPESVTASDQSRS